MKIVSFFRLRNLFRYVDNKANLFLNLALESPKPTPKSRAKAKKAD